jgi:hypothetical protein
MTKLEALARAETLWDGVWDVEPLPGHPGEWLVNTVARVHLIGADGNPTCHERCIKHAQEVAA